MVRISRWAPFWQVLVAYALQGPTLKVTEIFRNLQVVYQKTAFYCDHFLIGRLKHKRRPALDNSGRSPKATLETTFDPSETTLKNPALARGEITLEFGETVPTTSGLGLPLELSMLLAKY